MDEKRSGQNVKVVKTYGDWWTKYQLILRDGACCHYCGYRFSASVEGWYFMTIDHLEPKGKVQEGDKNDFSNLRLACKSCNSSKGRASLDDLGGLEPFRCETKRARRVSEAAMAERMRALEELRDWGVEPAELKTPCKLGAKLIDTINDSGLAHARKQRSRLDRIRITRELGGEPYIWNFQVDNLLLRPVFIGKLADENTEVVKQLLLLGFFWFPRSSDAYKLLPPFVGAKHGLLLIKREILAVEDLLESLGLGPAVRSS